MAPQTNDAGAKPPSVRGQAFGVGIEANFPIPGLPPAPTESERDARRTVRLELVSGSQIADCWPPGAEALPSLFGPDGAVTQRIEIHPDAGYRFDWPGWGEYVISSDGGLVRCAPPAGTTRIWQRYLIGQILPFVAVLAGFEAFHASAVTTGERTIAFAGGSGSGKSCLASVLRLRNWDLVADDVVAASLQGDGTVLAHPGFGTVNMRRDAIAALGPAEMERLGTEHDADEKGIRLLARPVPGARPWSSLYLLQRSSAVGELIIERLRPVAPLLLLSATYNLILQTRDRLIRQLDVCAGIASSVAVFRMTIPANIRPFEVADRVQEQEGVESMTAVDAR